MNQEYYYIHEVQYYETDGMRIVHHSNYIRWFEEARLAQMKLAGLDYDRMEERGIIIPVLSASCDYKAAVRFGDKVKIMPRVETFNGLRFELTYQVWNMEETVLHAAGSTTHCFLDSRMRPINVKKCAKDIYEYFSAYLKK
ncbi:acyl-CoA thioesterase YbgC [uncultured Roseburia sp.]|uniref:Acyl-CoA thioesterase n=1 Tax=Brotonthovivens ammoniilytica TaxID=2981725 RepID=A0ABT2TI62_9FIRM|nr:thioesterase family protein [Brotonthovivens ammoniilytica]MCU6761841.1 acyl-CoA thioesterase [Brotonthovivens ammoniilytica]SCI48255.1 acyl-CoA thioesterase YbgC [uncultured Roseburia sp.]